MSLWKPKVQQAALWLAQGYTSDETAEKVGVCSRTIDRWRSDIEFSAEVDRLSCMVDIASRAYRLRKAMRIARKLGEHTDKDLLDWLKYAQSETDGVKLEIAALIDAATSVAGGGSAGAAEPQPGSDDDAVAPATGAADAGV